MPRNSSFSSRQWLTLFTIGAVHFSSAICISLQAPFYPEQAESKGVTATEYGLVFGSFQLVAFLTSPIYGKYVDRIGVKRLLNIGMVLAAFSAILFGMLDYVQDHFWFLSLSFLLRMSESLGSTGALVSAFSITATVFPEALATTFATLEVFYGLGFIAGPSVGGVLFSFGGFKLPFIINGLALLLIAIIIAFIFPPIVLDSNQQSQEGILDYLRVPTVLFNSIAIVATAISVGYYTATLEPHLRVFDLSPVEMGLMFIISGGTYALLAPVVGYVCDHWINPKRVISVGFVFFALSFSIVGPAPFVPLPRTLPLCIFGLVLQGIGMAACMVPTLMDSIRSAVLAGYRDDISTYGILSGLWAASFSLGSFIGPSVAGVLYDKVGFSNGTVFIISLHTVLFIMSNYFIMSEKSKNEPVYRVQQVISHRRDSDDKVLSSEEFNKGSTSDLTKRISLPNRQNQYGSIP